MAAAAERVYGASDPKYRSASAPPPRAWIDPDREKGWFRRLMPVLAALIAATGTDPVLLALPVAMAASWGFMLPSGTGPNALAWATGNIALPRMLKAGLALDLLGVPLLIGIIWAIAAIA